EAAGSLDASGTVDQTAQGDAKRHFIDARVAYVSRYTKQAVAGRLRGADARVGGGSVQNDFRDVGESFHVVDHGWRVKQTRLRGEGMLVGWLATESLDGIEERGFFAADVSACATAKFDVESKAGAENRRA